MLCRLFFMFIFSVFYATVSGEIVIENFQGGDNTSSWFESSDTIVEDGKSKASFTILESGSHRRAVLFTLLDPQEGGACFAGVKKSVQLNLTGYQNISLNVKSQGQYKGYEFCLRDRGLTGVKAPAYCQFFQAPQQFETIDFPIDDFKPYFEGAVLTNYTQLDRSNVTQLALLAYGGVRLPKEFQQVGVAALEINWIVVF